MGIFDIFNTSDQQAAAQAQISGLNSGYNLASGAINTGIGSLNSNFGNAVNTLGSNFGAGAGALTSNFGAAGNALTSNFGAAGNALNTNYAAALQPYLQNYGQAQTGVNQLGNVLGLNGQPGSDAAMKTLQATPGYQFQLDQGNNAINAQAAATGMNASGNQAIALDKFSQGLAGTTYNNYVNQLQPFLGASNSAAGGIAGVNTGLGSQLAGVNTGLGTSLAGVNTGLGTSLANNSANLGTSTAGVQTGLGTQLAGQQDKLAQLGYSTQTGIGNANANADLAGLTASGNFWNMFGGLGKTAASFGTGGLSNLFSSGGGSDASGNSTSGGSIFSDERLKEDIEPVGELSDGQPVYRYRYIGDNIFRIGLMAQDVEHTHPEAVTEVGGYKAVDYGKATQFAGELSRFLEAA